jgi:hypothetical protein
MDFTKILSISGKSGLFKVVSQLKNAVLVESLTDKKRFPAFAHDKISSMEEIAVFTVGEAKPLKEIFKTLYENKEGKPTIDPKTGDKELKEYFLTLVPDYDQDRVYISDIRKIISWYNLLVENQLLDFTEKAEDEKKDEDKTPGEYQEKIIPENKNIISGSGPQQKKGTVKASEKKAPTTHRRKSGK